MFNWFKKKQVNPEVPKKLNLDKYEMRMSIKALCLFEKLSEKSFYSFDGDDIATLAYAVFVCSNDYKCKLSTFTLLLEDLRFAKWVGEQMNTIFNYIVQFSEKEKEEESEADGEKSEKALTITSIANTLIVQYGMDAHYVMDEMELWQIGSAYDAVQSMVEERYEEKRLWTYLSILPHVDGKKLNKPEKLIAFPWEAEEKKKKAEEELKNNQFAIKNLIGKKLDFIK